MVDKLRTSLGAILPSFNAPSLGILKEGVKYIGRGVAKFPSELKELAGKPFVAIGHSVHEVGKSMMTKIHDKQEERRDKKRSLPPETSGAGHHYILPKGYERPWMPTAGMIVTSEVGENSEERNTTDASPLPNNIED